MATRARPLTLIWTAQAERELHQIWLYNAEHRGAAAADDYEAFLLDQASRGVRSPQSVRSVEGYPELRQLIARMKPSGDGHVIIYKSIAHEDSFLVLHVYHTKMDIKKRLREDL